MLSKRSNDTRVTHRISTQAPEARESHGYQEAMEPAPETG